MNCATSLLRATAAAAFVAGTSPALAHADGGLAHGILHGLEHPVSGWDHLIAMVSVGLWGAFLGKRAMLLLPAIFPVVMALGAALAMAGIAIPAVEIGIPASAIVLGIAVALATQPPFWVAALVVGAFAIFHGHAHGVEIPSATDPFAYAIGFVTATVLLHWTGIALGLLSRWPAGRAVVRAAGAAVALIGVVFLSKSMDI